MLLMALMLMPLGMVPAPASTPQQGAIAGMPMGHCPNPGPNHAAKGGLAECTMACAAALPAADGRDGGPLLIVCEPMMPGAAHQLRGLHPETATPPPKRS
jgi:hypothetical protein